VKTELLDESTYEGEDTQGIGSVLLASTPYRLKRFNEGLIAIDRFGLSRSHKHIFLLINGYLTTAELVGLSRRRWFEL